MEKKSIQIFSNPQFGEISRNGKHLSIRMNGCEEVYDEYDMLAIASKQEIDGFKYIIKFLDMAVPIENDTYFRLRCELYENKSFWEIQQRNAIDRKKVKTYLMTDSDTGATKIGRSINPPKRERTLQSEKKEISLLMVCDKDVEKKLHNKYSHKHIRGEWYNLSDKDIKEIAQQYGFKIIAK